MIGKFIRDERGATAIEYGLIAALVAVAAIGALKTMGEGLVSSFDDITTNLNSAQ